ncbi:MAG: fused MFS/spermidine synthase, partial [Actinomycetia bacterium]|nr:fused MFS/spermidine synthase [Actinomycetes bacterium]
FILIPMVGLRWANLFAVAINLAIALFSFSLSKQQRLAVISAVVFGGAILISLIRPSPGIAFGYGIADHFASYDRYKEINRNSKTLFDKESNYGRVQVFENLEKEGSEKNLFLMINGRFEGASLDDTNVRLLSYLPMTIVKEPRSAMIIGLGTGTTLATLAKDQGLKSIDSVEINPTAYEAVSKHFYPDLFKDKRINVIGDDARHYMGLTRKKYEIIVSAPSYPTSKAVSHLFTKDFYEIAKSKLKKNGAFVQWLPGYLLDREDMQTAVKTLLSAYPNTYAIRVHNNDIIFVALKSKKSEPLDVEAIESEINGLGDQNIWGWQFRAGPRTLAKAVSSPDIALNTDDLPLIEFTSMRRKYSPKVEEVKEERGLESILQR